MQWDTLPMESALWRRQTVGGVGVSGVATGQPAVFLESMFRTSSKPAARNRLADSLSRAIWALPTLLLSLACGAGSEAPLAQSLPGPLATGAAEARTSASGLDPNAMPTRLVLGDIEPDEPLTRAQRFRPLASLLERRLAPYGVSSVSVVIAPNIETMAAMMRRGEVDLLFDSIFPTLMVRSQTAITPVLARQVNKPLYSSLLIARIDGPASLEELRGEILALQDPHSTSGFLLPKILLQRAGIEPEILTDWSSPVSQERCGIWLCGSEENVVELVRTGKVAAGALSDEHYAQLPSSLRHGLRIVASSPQVPRQIVSVRGNLDPSLLQALRRVLLAIDDEERRSLAAEDPEEPWNWQFANLDDAALAMLEEIELSMSVVLSPGDS